MLRVCSVFLLAISPLLSLPTGMQNVEGEVSAPILNEDGSLLIKSGHKSSADWESFSIAPGEHVIFEQASVNSSFLNRVIGNEGSELLGRLSSNGSIFLINPNGILIGPSAEI
ncbi:MAG: adhesin, partial [Chlamydiae bacterium CG10_big_fil_rev_8_21_14_0_10_42_34]